MWKDYSTTFLLKFHRNRMTNSIDPRKIDLNQLVIGGFTVLDVQVPFDITAKDFLDSASEDLAGQSTRDTINALGNIKRTIDCLFDSLLFALNFLEYSKRERWSFPEKMNFLSEIGIITPYILGRINTTRNLLEHEFKKPNRTEVETAYDVAALLFYATVRFTKGFTDILDLETEDRKWQIEIRIDREKRRIDVLHNEYEFSVTWDQNPEDYKRWLNVVFQAMYHNL